MVFWAKNKTKPISPVYKLGLSKKLPLISKIFAIH